MTATALKLPLACGCYNFDEPAKEPDDGHEHCWHKNLDMRQGLRDNCGLCGKWRDVFDG
jgi:hypothetical protein